MKKVPYPTGYNLFYSISYHLISSHTIKLIFMYFDVSAYQTKPK